MDGRAGSLGRIIAHGWKSGYGFGFVGDVLKEECIKRGYYTRVKNTLWRALCRSNDKVCCSMEG